jgi:hypothetical protein
MDINSFGRAFARFAAGVGLAIAISACGMALEDPPRAMYGTATWSDAWQVTCNDAYPSGTEPSQLVDEHLDNDCQQYRVAQQMRSQEPRFASAPTQ